MAQVLNKPLFVVFNKTDLVEEAGRLSVMKKTRAQLDKMGFQYECSVLSAATGQGVDSFKQLLSNTLRVPKRTQAAGNTFSLLVDHCFSLSNKGVVCTGTVLSGTVRLSDIVEFPQLQGTEKHKKINNLQMFRKNIKEAQ